MEYNEKYADRAREILSKPFKSKQHVCQAIGISVKTFESWLTEIEPFEQAVNEGFLNGEVAARDFIARAALLPAKISLDTYEKLARDIYGLGVNDDIADNNEVVRWRVEFVRPQSKDS